MENELIKARLAENIQFYRKQKLMTQLELAEYLNYSDKAVSKWERAESAPDIFVINKLCQLFEVTLDELIYKKHTAYTPQSVRHKKHLTIALAAFVLVWFIAVTTFSILKMLNFDGFELWKIYIVALPFSAIVLLVFTSLWSKRPYIFLSISYLIWTLALMLTLLVPTSSSYLFFIIAIPVQIVSILIGYSLKYSKNNKEV
ncbi:helix-turn-helix domain-containing protein [Mycoplasmatota bacterium]|nr:helix-turn-helix domain-containing protein [Mycoplasmatota bacterium]